MAAPAVQKVLKKTINDSMLQFVRSAAAEELSAQEILGWGLKNFGDKIALSCSFGAPEGMALLDMLHRVDPAARTFTLDTGRVHQATYDLIDRIRQRYDMQVEVLFPRAEDVEDMTRRKGLNLFYESVENRQICCRIRKVEPLNRYLAGLDAWVTGLRRDQNVTRADTPKVEIDRVHGGMIKLNPIADWTSDQVMAYIRAHDVPINRLHEEGYPSVGCAPCTRAIRPGEDIRAGRWWWENAESKECGIHVDEENQGSGI